MMKYLTVLMMMFTVSLNAQSKYPVSALTKKKAAAYGIEKATDLNCFAYILKEGYKVSNSNLYKNMDLFKKNYDANKLGFELKRGRNLIEKYFIVMFMYKRQSEKKQALIKKYFKGMENTLDMKLKDFNKTEKAAPEGVCDVK